MRHSIGAVVLVLMGCVCAKAQEPFRHRVLDDLLPKLEALGTENNVVYIDRALREAGEAADPRLIYFLRRYRCEQLYYQGLLDESMVEAETARRIAIELKDSALIASSLNQVAVLMEERNDDAQGIALLKEALRWYPVHVGYTYPLATPHRIQGNLGLCWANLGEADSARSCQQRSLQLARQAGVPRGEALALLELGRLEVLRSRTDSALALLDSSISVANAHGIFDAQLDALAAKAEVQVGRREEMLAGLNAGHALMNEHDDIAKRSVLAFMEVEVRSLARADRYKEALVAARRWRALDRSVRTSGARTAQRILQDMKATDAELVAEHDRALLTAVEVRAEERSRLVWTIGGALIAVLLLALVRILIARSRQKARLARMAVSYAEQERQIADLRVRQQVAEDLHDDLGAGLSALKLNCELAADASADAYERARTRNLATIAGNLIDNMRHILWSLSASERSIEEVVVYITDRARALCAEHDRTIAIKTVGEWPAVPADAEVCHLAWPVVRDALGALVEGNDDLELDLHWDQGLSVVVGSAATDRSLRSLLVDRIATHHLHVSRIGGWLRTSTEGPLRSDLFLPCAPDSKGNRAWTHAPHRIATGLVMLLCVMAAQVSGQANTAYRHPVLDKLFAPSSVEAFPTARIDSINVAISDASNEDNDRLIYHLLMARAKEMYYQGLYDMGIADVNRSLELATALQDSLLIATTYNMIGLLNENLDNAAITLPWFRTAARWLPRNTECIYPVVKDHHIDGNIAQCLLDLGRNDSAEYHFRRSRSRALFNGDLRAIALANLGLARTSLARGVGQEMELLLDSAQVQALRCGSTDVYVDAFPVRARYMLRREGRAAATRTLDKATAFVRMDSTINRSSVRKFLEQTSLLREEMGQYKEAYEAWDEWQQLDSTIRTMDNKAALATLRSMLDNTQGLERERAIHEQAQAQLAIDRSFRYTSLFAAGITTALLFGLLALFLNRQRYTRSMVALELERAQGRRELAQLRARQRLSEDMLAELGTGLEALRIRSQLSSSMEPEPDDRARMTRIGSQASELIIGLRQIIWALDTGHSGLAETMRFTAHYASTYCAQHGLHLNLHLAKLIPEVPLTMEQRRNIFLVVKEALHNVVKHARATEVEVRMTCVNELLVHIADNGRGPAATQGQREGNGLRNMRKRVEAIGGTFSAPIAKGMVIQFSIPLPYNNGST